MIWRLFKSVNGLFFILVFEICTVGDKLFTRIGKNHIRILVVGFTAELWIVNDLHFIVNNNLV